MYFVKTYDGVKPSTAYDSDLSFLADLKDTYEFEIDHHQTIVPRIGNGYFPVSFIRVSSQTELDEEFLEHISKRNTAMVCNFETRVFATSTMITEPEQTWSIYLLYQAEVSPENTPKWYHIAAWLLLGGATGAAMSWFLL